MGSVCAGVGELSWDVGENPGRKGGSEPNDILGAVFQAESKEHLGFPGGTLSEAELGRV